MSPKRNPVFFSASITPHDSSPKSLPDAQWRDDKAALCNVERTTEKLFEPTKIKAEMCLETERVRRGTVKPPHGKPTWLCRDFQHPDDVRKFGVTLFAHHAGIQSPPRGGDGPLVHLPCGFPPHLVTAFPCRRLAPRDRLHHFTFDNSRVRPISTPQSTTVSSSSLGILVVLMNLGLSLPPGDPVISYTDNVGRAFFWLNFLAQEE